MDNSWNTVERRRDITKFYTTDYYFKCWTMAVLSINDMAELIKYATDRASAISLVSPRGLRSSNYKTEGSQWLN